jgi:hypothetical protein
MASIHRDTLICRGECALSDGLVCVLLGIVDDGSGCLWRSGLPAVSPVRPDVQDLASQCNLQQVIQPGGAFCFGTNHGFRARREWR